MGTNRLKDLVDNDILRGKFALGDIGMRKALEGCILPEWWVCLSEWMYDNQTQDSHPTFIRRYVDVMKRWDNRREQDCAANRGSSWTNLIRDEILIACLHPAGRFPEVQAVRDVISNRIATRGKPDSDGERMRAAQKASSAATDAHLRAVEEWHAEIIRQIKAEVCDVEKTNAIAFRMYSFRAAKLAMSFHPPDIAEFAHVSAYHLLGEIEEEPISALCESIFTVVESVCPAKDSL